MPIMTHQEIVSVAEDGPGEYDDEADEGGVLEVGELELAGPEFHPPPDLRVCRRRLESHRLPE